MIKTFTTVVMSFAEAAEAERLLAAMLRLIFESDKLKKTAPDEQVVSDVITIRKERALHGVLHGNLVFESLQVPEGADVTEYCRYLVACLNTHLIAATGLNSFCKIEAFFKSGNEQLQEKGTLEIGILFKYPRQS